MDRFILKITQVEEEGDVALRVTTHNEDFGHLSTTLSPSFNRFLLKH
jgi:hypothetical protein